VVTVSPMVYFSNVPATGFYFTSTVFSDDPTRYTLTVATIMEEYHDKVTKKSDHVTLVRHAAAGLLCIWRCFLHSRQPSTHEHRRGIVLVYGGVQCSDCSWR
jgi:hypothetical protein